MPLSAASADVEILPSSYKTEHNHTLMFTQITAYGLAEKQDDGEGEYLLVDTRPEESYQCAGKTGQLRDHRRTESRRGIGGRLRVG